MSEDTKDLSVREAAELLSVSTRFVWDLVASGQVASYKVGRSRRIRRDSFEAIRGNEDAA